MESKRFTVCIKIGLQTSLEFETIIGPVLCADGLAYVEVDKEGNIIPDRGMIRFNNSLTRIAIGYLGFKMVVDVLEQKTVGNCHHFKCVTDLSRVDVYVCETEKWSLCGEDIFIS